MEKQTKVLISCVSNRVTTDKGEGVKISGHFADVIHGGPLMDGDGDRDETRNASSSWVAVLMVF